MWFTQDGLRPQQQDSYFIIQNRPLQKVHTALIHDISVIPQKSLIVRSYSEHLALLTCSHLSSATRLNLTSSSFPSTPKPLHIYTFTIGLSSY